MSVPPPRLPGIRIPLACLILLAGVLMIGALAAASPALAQAPAPAPTLRDLMATGEGREMYPPFDPDTHHYAVGCGGGALTLTLSATDAETRVTVNGVRRASGNARIVLRELHGDSDVVVELESGEGGSAAYTIHCLPDDFPPITARKSPDASDMLILASMNNYYIAILDTNGVPRFHRGTSAINRLFKYHPDGLYPFSYFLRVEQIPTYRGVLRNDYEAVILDWDLSIVDVVSTAPPIIQTDSHDFIIKPNGNYVLIAYEPVRRDFSSLRDPDGNAYSATEGTEDSVIQEITPEREQVFLWNSWDHLAVTKDCTQHFFPRDYAHVNSLEIVEGDIIASFRGCSQVLRIDGTSGDVVWLLGKSNRGDAEWIASGSRPPLRIVGDPYGEFCGQHAARIGPGGNLILYDNGMHCLVDPETGASTRASGVFSRVVEYALDPETGSATFVRHHSLHGTFDRLGYSQGHVELLENGNWLIGWGRPLLDDDPEIGLPPDESITEVNPRTGEVLLSITVGEDPLHIRPYPLPPDALEWRPARHLDDLEPGWNRIVWRGPDGVSVASATAGIGTISSVWTRDAEPRSWLGFFPDSPFPLATNTLSAFTAGQRYWIAVGER